MPNEASTQLIREFEGKTKIFQMFSATMSEKVKEMADILFENHSHVYV
jgi:hypothetical protein